MIETVVNKHHQFLLASLSICLVFSLSLSTVSKTIHDGLFHPDLVTDNNPTNSGCTGPHEGACDGGESSKHTEDCESLSCPVNVFSHGALALDYVPVLNSIPATRSKSLSENLISYHYEEEKKSHLVRGPPKEKQV